ncbi:phage conserved hypothetical protein [Palleronia marisminoris]|uniref:Phage tail assembly chaperone n=1 Tax=Palleronia marisminoris TaxID=315423 RepID=A0A1Y5RGJ8_9RHOB|nr:rcc01693 family protein [Palleronia marisminoris]SFG18626.1 phage conserved hypothetical protein [Palleronia marisminoris]SLN16971.1 hypothetical protein PAM7066_00440 [Palleronia marisminoris]
MTAFDWPALLRAGIAMGLKPHEFWALTPSELEMMLGRGAGVAPMGRGRLEELRAAFPDERRRARHE